MANHEGKTTALAFLAGAAIGVGIGMLFAPASGTETRRKIKDMANKAKGKAQELASRAQETAQDLGNRFSAAAHDIVDGEESTRARH